MAWHNRVKLDKGFTIVELLMVIVIVGILAALVITAYNGIQQRANNASRISAARQVVEAIKAYKTANNDRYPMTGVRCLTQDNSCSNYAGTTLASDNSDMLSLLATVAKMPNSVPRQSGSYYGIYYDYYAPRTYNGALIPVIVMYWLDGNNQKCNMHDVMMSGSVSVPGPDGSNPFITSTTGYTQNNGTSTACYISV